MTTGPTEKGYTGNTPFLYDARAQAAAASLNIDVDLFLQNALLGTEPRQQREIIAKSLKQTGHVEELINFIEKAMAIAIKHKIIDEKAACLQKQKLYEVCQAESQPIPYEEFCMIDSPMFQAIYIRRHPQLLARYFSEIPAHKKSDFLKLAASWGAYEFVLSKLSDNALSLQDVEAIYRQLNQEQPLKFKAGLLLYAAQGNSPFHRLSADAKLKILKENSAITSEDCTDLMQLFARESIADQLEAAWHFCNLYPEEMLYKLENFPCLTLAQKLKLFLKIMALYPNLAASWKAAFREKTRLELCKTSTFMTALSFFESASKENKSEEELFRTLLLKGNELFGEKNVCAHVISGLNRAPQTTKKEMLLWLAYALDQSVAACPVAGAKVVQSLIASVSNIDPKFRFLVTAYLFDPKMIAHFSHLDPERWVEGLCSLLGIEGRARDILLSSGKENLVRIVSACILVKMHPAFSDQEKTALIQEILSARTFEDMRIKACVVDVLIRSGALQPQEILSANAIELFAQRLQQWLNLEISDPFENAKRYAETFGSFRIPEGLFVYAKGLQGLQDPEMKRRVLDSLKALVNEVYSNHFLNNRYDPKTSPHLGLISSLYPDLLSKWKDNTIEGKIDDFLNQPPKFSLSDCTMHEIDNIQDLFLCTTEVGGSCLTIYGNCDDNKGFLAYVMDGKNKVLAVKDTSGKLVARAVLRFVLDQDQQPVLLLDTFYTSVPYHHSKETPSPYMQLEEAIKEAAKRKAKSMGVPLVSAFSSSQAATRTLYPKPVISLAGRVPYECCNAVGALGKDEMCEAGKFELEKTLLVP